MNYFVIERIVEILERIAVALEKLSEQKSCITCEHSSTEKESDECYTCSRYYNDNYVPRTERRDK